MKINKRKNKKNIMRVGCWNITSFSNKDQELIIEMNKHKIDICALSETKKKGKGSTKFSNYILIYSGKNKNERASSGVGFLVNEKFEHSIKAVEYISDRLLMITLNIKPYKETHYISVYAPDITKPQEEKDQFYDELQEILNNIPPKDEVIILGDLNARVGNNVIPRVKSLFNEAITNENGDQLSSFCMHNELRINNTFFDHKPQHKYTFHNSRGLKSTIDFIITNKVVHPRNILDVRVLSSANVGTDHNLVMMKIRECPVRKRNEIAVKVEKFNIESFTDESTQQLYKNRLKYKIQCNNISEEDNVDMAWQKLKTNILEATTEAIGKRVVNVTNAKRNIKPWFCDEVKKLAADKRTAYLKYRAQQITYIDYKIVRNRVNDSISKIKTAFWEKFSKDMEHDLYGAQKKVWGMLRNRKKPVNEYLTLKNISLQSWEEYFRNLFNNSDRYLSSVTNDIDLATEERPFSITPTTVRNNILKLKNRKSPGPDKITNEMIKYGGEELNTEITKLFQKIVTVEKVPKEWKNSITIPIFKKGNKQMLENYRGITLLNTMLKLFTKIIADEVASTGISEEQQGFRKNRSTTDAIFILRQITEKAIEFDKPAFLCFIDLTKAFDRVQLPDVIKLLHKRRLNKKTIAIIEDLNRDNCTSIRIDNELSAIVPTPTGIRQGDSLSPTLFNIIMDHIIEKVKSSGVGYKMGDHEIKIICYADDAVLVSSNENDLQRLLFAFEKTAANLNMMISTEKTKCMTISKQPLRCKLAVYDKPICQVMEFNYLGSVITSGRDLKTEVYNQANKAGVVSGYLRDVIWTNKYMQTKSKVRIYKTCVRPILTYAQETRADTQRTQNIMTKVEMRALRSIAGYSLRDHKTNVEILQLCDIQGVTKWSRKRRKEWHQHVQRMEQNRLAKVTMDETPGGRRLRGRPPKRWRECWTSGSTENY